MNVDTPLKQTLISRRRLWTFIFSAAAVLGVLPATSSGQIYVVNSGTSVDEYGYDGSPLQPSLASGFTNISSLALSGGVLFVADTGAGTVGEYSSVTQGGSINASFPITGLTDPLAIVDSGNNLFVAQTVGSFGAVTEYSATTGASATFSVSSGLGTTAPVALAISGTNLYVVDSTGMLQAFDTTTANSALGGFTPVTQATLGFAADALAVLGGVIYVGGAGNTISEYDATTGAFISSFQLTGATVTTVGSISVSGGELYAGYNGNTVGEFNLDGSPVQTALISGLSTTVGIAFTPVPEPYWAGLAALLPIAFLGWSRHRRNLVPAPAKV